MILCICFSCIAGSGSSRINAIKTNVGPLPPAAVIRRYHCGEFHLRFVRGNMKGRSIYVHASGIERYSLHLCAGFWASATKEAYHAIEGCHDMPRSTSDHCGNSIFQISRQPEIAPSVRPPRSEIILDVDHLCRTMSAGSGPPNTQRAKASPMAPPPLWQFTFRFAM